MTIMTHNEFVIKISKINPDIEIIGKYTKAIERVKVRCRKCGNIWTPKAYSLTQGKGCPHCSAIKGAKINHGKTGVKSKDDFIKQLKTIDDLIEVCGEYQNTHTNISCRCLRCGYTWSPKPYSLLQGHGCPKCAKSGTSFMEQFLLLSFRSALGNHEVLSRDRTTIGMELDIYIPKLKIAIEPGNWNLHKKNLSRDKEKRVRCSNLGITLYTIYDVYPVNTPPPFESNCITYSFDLNKADHKIIQKLVRQLFDIFSITKNITDEEFKDIEEYAYNSAKSLTHEEFIKRIQILHPTIKVLGKYQNTNKRILVKCENCGYEWDAVPASLLSGDGCRKCGTIKAHSNFIKSQENFISEVKKVNPDVEILGTYTGRHNPVLTRCKICGYTWRPQASSLLRGSSHKGSNSIHKNLKS